MVYEYYNSSVFPPPFSILAFFFSIKSKTIPQAEENVNRDNEGLFLEKKSAEEYSRCKNQSKMENWENKIKTNTEK